MIKALFGPIINILSRLRYAKKFFLIGVVIILPLFATLLMLLNEQTSGIRFAQKERMGLEYIQSLRVIFDNLQKHRGMSSTFLGGSAPEFKEKMSSKQRDIEQNVGDVDSVEQKYGAFLETTQKWNELKREIEGLRSKVWGFSVQESIDQHTRLIEKVFDLIAYLGDASNLMFDPQPDTFHLMFSVVSSLPQLSEYMGKTRAVSTGLAAKNTATSGEKKRLIMLYGLITENINSIAQQFEDLWEINPMLKPQLEGLIKDMLNDVTAYSEEIVNKQIIEKEVIEVSAVEVFDASTKAIDRVFKAFDQSALLLDGLLKVRVENFSQKRNIAVGISLVTLLLLFYIFTGFYLCVVPQIRKLVSVTEIIAKGDFSPEVEVMGKDEVGVLAGAFRTVVIELRKAIGEIGRLMAALTDGDLTKKIEIEMKGDFNKVKESINSTIDALQKIVTQVLDVAERVSSSSQQLSSTAQEMNATAEEVSSTVQQIAKGTETQAQRVEETKKVMEQMSASVTQVSKSAQDAASQASRAAESAQKGGDSAKEAQEKMIQMAQIIGDSANVVKKLGERSDQIGEIVNVITKIADQTNLLALNAAIEAARAGEYGRGFAVVAEEVRKLAEGSAKAADEIGKLIKDVQKETNQAVTNIEGVSKETAFVRDIAQKVGQNLGDIIKNAEGVATMIEQVSAASEQQASGTQQVSKSVTDIASVSEQTASATQEASASSEEMTASMEQMAASAQELADMGIQLRGSVGKFKIGEQEKVQRTEDRVQRPKGVSSEVEGKAGESPRLAKLKEQTDAMKKRMAELRDKREKSEARIQKPEEKRNI